MNRHPISPVTREVVETYARDGVAYLPKVLDRDWVELLLESWREVKEELEQCGAENLVPSRFLEMDARLKDELGQVFSAESFAQRAKDAPVLGAKHMWLWHPGFRRFALESPVGEVVGQVLQAKEVRFFWDQMFIKRPGGDLDTYWHTDQGAWPTLGDQLPTVWIPLTPIDEDQSLEYVLGSHMDSTEYWGRSANALRTERDGLRPEGRPDFIDYETRRGDESVRFARWAMEPGDAVMFHPRLYHGGGPNRNKERERIALSTRWFGDDIVWNPRPSDVNIPGMPHEKMVRGQRPDDDSVFPVVWRQMAEAA